MARLKIQKYYYFKTRNDIEYEIKVSLIQINTRIMQNYKEFTPKQIAFYKEHPDASVEEVVKCELNPPYVPPVPDVQQYIDINISNLLDMCRGYMSVTYFEYEMANATIQKAAHLLYYTGNTYYNLNEAKSIMKIFMDESVEVMAIFKKYKPLIESSQTIPDVDAYYDNAIEELNEWKCKK